MTGRTASMGGQFSSLMLASERRAPEYFLGYLPPTSWVGTSSHFLLVPFSSLASN